MKKVYRLLRNNQESGPYTIDELLQQQLQPSDLVWVEGRSTAWSLLSELELQPPMPEMDMTESGNVLTDMSISNEEKTGTVNRPLSLEEKAEVLRQRAMASQPIQIKVKERKEPVVSSGFIANESIDFIDHRKDKLGISYEVVAAALVTAIVGISMIGGRSLFHENRDLVNAAATQIISDDSHKAKKAIHQEHIAAPVLPLPDTTVAISQPVAIKKPTVSPVKKEAVAPLLPDSTPPKDDLAIVKVKKDEDTPKVVAPADASVVKKDTAPAPVKEEMSQEPTEKKKSLGQAIRGLFKKKNKNN